MPKTTVQGPTYLVGRWNGPEGQNLEVYEKDKDDDGDDDCHVVHDFHTKVNEVRKRSLCNLILKLTITI